MTTSDIPDWKSRDIAVTVSNILQSYIVAIRLLCRHKKKTYQNVYSGFCVKIGEDIIWATAGHCIESITQLVQNKDVSVKALQLMDDSPREINGIPIETPLPPNAFFDSLGVDVGFMYLRPAYTIPLLANSRVRLAVPGLHFGTPFEPDFYYLLGIPDAWTESSDVEIGKNLRAASLVTLPSCLPVEIIPDKGKQHDLDDFWGLDRTSIYGRIYPYANDEGKDLDHVGGMSGGLLIGAKWVPSDSPDRRTLDFRFMGIQSASPGSDPHIIRATRFTTILEVAQHVIERVKNAESTVAVATTPLT